MIKRYVHRSLCLVLGMLSQNMVFDSCNVIVVKRYGIKPTCEATNPNSEQHGDTSEGDGLTSEEMLRRFCEQGDSCSDKVAVSSNNIVKARQVIN